MTRSGTYPVRVDADLGQPLSRWLWLIKPILGIPHFLVLACLWIAYVALTLVALIAIVATGRYPARIFMFNVGVLRWTWRVQFYAAGGFATDLYPPFSLADDPSYPAHLEIDYPEQLSRGLALVKWWLLAIPHYVIIGIFCGGGCSLSQHSGGGAATWPFGGGLITLLAIIAAIVLLVTGSYPQSLFDLVLGLDRWVLRVAAYAGLMTDQYP